MWQRFSERARKVVFYAQEEAQKFGEGYVSTEHLLLGLVRDSDSTAINALTALGVVRERIRTEVERQLPRGESRGGQDMTLTPRAKRVIDLAYDEARNLNQDYIGTEHLLLGLIREGDGIAGRVLAQLGVELEKVRLFVLSNPQATAVRPAVAPGPLTDLVSRLGARFGLRFGTRPGTTPEPRPTNDQIWERCTPRMQAIIDAARNRAITVGAAGIGAEHLILALLDDPECRGMRAVTGLAPDLERIRRAAEGLASVGGEIEAPDPLPFGPSGQLAIASADIAATGMGNPFVGTEHLALVLFGGAAGEFVDPETLAPVRVREAIARSQAEE